MDEEKIVVKYDRNKMRTMAGIVLLLAVLVAGLGVLLFFFRLKTRDWLYLAVFLLLAAGLIFTGVNYLMRANNPVIFVVTGKKLSGRQLRGVTKVEEVVAIAGSVNFGRSGKGLSGLGSLEEVAAMPPLPHRTGDLVVQTANKQYRFQYVADIFEVMERLKEVFPDWQMLLWTGQNKRYYHYWDPQQEPEQAATEETGEKKEKKTE